MKFRLVTETLIAKRVDEDYHFLYSKITHNQMIIGKDLRFLLSGDWFDIDCLPITITEQEKQALKSSILQNSEFFSFDGSNNELDDVPKITEYSSDRYTDKLCRIFSNNPKPWWIIVEAVTSCNLRCKHCYNCNDNTFIPPAYLEKLLSSLSDEENFSVVLTGGEVMTHPELPELLRILKKYNKVVSFNTNGTLLNEAKLKSIIRSGCVIDTFQLSLYAVDATIHDKITGVAGSFNRTLKAIELLQKNQFKVKIAALITPDNVDQVKPLIAFAKERHIKINFCFKCISNCHDACANSECDLSPEQFSDAYTDYLDSINHFYLNPRVSYDHHICMAGINKCTLGADGSLFLCPTWKEYPFANIQELSSFSEFWEGKQISTIRQISADDFQVCSTCEIHEYCRPCLADNFNKNRNIMEVNADHCRLEKQKHRLEIERLKRNDS